MAEPNYAYEIVVAPKGRDDTWFVRIYRDRDGARVWAYSSFGLGEGLRRAAARIEEDAGIPAADQEPSS